MWKLTEVYAQNICSFKELHFKPQQGVTTLIFGDNRDNESQRSNGSGKSALIECIALGITGSPLRKIKSEEIINDTSEESLIELQLENSINKVQFTIERKIFRKSTSQVACFLTDGSAEQRQEQVLSGNDAYNKFILETLGLTKDEIYNNFVLSKHKYQDFLSCSDKEKKEIINRFSNGNMVDQAIDKILEDKNPYAELLQKTDIQLAGVTGRMDMLREQIEKEENSKEERAKSKQDKIIDFEKLITEKRTLIREKAVDLTKLDAELLQIQDADQCIQDLENSERTLEEYLEGVSNYVSLITRTPLTDWKSIIKTKKDKIAHAEEELKKWDLAFQTSEKKVRELNKAYEELNKEHTSFLSQCENKSELFNNELKQLNELYVQVNSDIERIKSIRRSLATAIENLKNKLAGTITCPQCGFEFIVADKDFDVQEGKTEVVGKEAEYVTLASTINDMNEKAEIVEARQDQIQHQKRELTTQKNEWADKIKASERDINIAMYELQSAERSQTGFIETVKRLQAEIEGVLRQVFDEAFDYVDEAYKVNERKKKTVLDDIKAYEGSIEGLKSTIEELKLETGSDMLLSLKNSLKEYQSQSSEILIKKSQIEEEIAILSRQEQNFIEFKTYLANTKIEALSKITNEFLEDIGSDIRIRFSGYTVLKSGKVREKISVSLIRSGLDSGSFGKFSAGEAARVNLATILAMQKLINANCDMEKGLDLLVLDEILEAVDEDGLASMFDALNKLGITSLVVSHGNIAESYPYKIKIVKENGESRIEE